MQAINFGTFIVFDIHDDMLNGLQSNPKSTVQDITTNSVSLNDDFTKIFEWAVQWKMNFNPDPCKQAQEELFSRGTSSKPRIQLQKHLGLFLDPKISFDEYIDAS